jgi:hypothetical protein
MTHIFKKFSQSKKFYFYNFLPVMPKIYPPGVTREKRRERDADRMGQVNVQNALPFVKDRFSAG